MVNTAAIVADKTFMESTPEDWKQMLDICLYGSMNVIHAVLPGMVERNYGRIVCLASDAAHWTSASLLLRSGERRRHFLGKIGRPRSWTQRRHTKCRLTGCHRHGTPSGTRERSLRSDRRRTLRQARANHPPHVSYPPAWTTRTLPPASYIFVATGRLGDGTSAQHQRRLRDGAGADATPKKPSDKDENTWTSISRQSKS